MRGGGQVEVAKPPNYTVKSITLELKFKDALRSRRISLDEEAVPAPRCCCKGCGESIPLDYAQQTDGEVVFRLTTFLKQHEECVPKQADHFA